MTPLPFETAEGHDSPSVRQLAVFLDNRLGQLLRLTQVIDQRQLKIIALSIVDSVDHAVVRLLCSDPAEAISLLRDEGFAVSVREVLVVELPPGRRGLLSIWAALLSAEVNVGYAYPLLPHPVGPAMAMAVDSLDIASDILRRQRLHVFGEDELCSGE